MHHVCMIHTITRVLTRARGLMFSGFEGFKRDTRLPPSSGRGFADGVLFLAGPAQSRPVTARLLLSRKPATPAYVRLCQGENRDKRRQAAMQLRDTRSGARTPVCVDSFCNVLDHNRSTSIEPSLRRISSSAQRLGNA